MTKGLAVFVHGWASSSRDLAEVAAVVQETLPDLDCVLIDHEGGAPLSNVRPEVVADRIAYEIELIARERAKQEPYNRIVLIGHSVGALLLKKAYVFACGSVEDSPAGESYAWPEKVDRLVSLAGIDRGVPLLQKTAQTSFPTFALRRLAYNVARLLRTATFIRALQRGDPFVSNLRVQWLRLRKGTGPIVITDFQLPVVYHLVGDRDSLIERDDSVDDLMRSDSYIYLTVVDADHTTIARPAQNSYARRELVAALTGTNLPLDPSNRRRPPAEWAKCGTDDDGQDMTDVFYVIHGIRDLGRTWTPGMCDAIRAAASADRTRKVRTVRSSYGYFSMLSFLMSFDRQKNVRWFMDLYTEMVARYPTARHHYVGHSNGTYILASALARYATCRVCNVVFAGSVVPSAYDWTKYHERKQVGYVRNDVGSADWVVALFPHLFEFVADVASRFDVNAPKWCDLGAAGFYGFFDDLSNDNTWLPGQHGAAIVPTNQTSIAQTVVFGRQSTPVPAVVGQDARVVLLSKFAWLFVPAAACVLVGALAAAVAGLALHGHPIAASICFGLSVIILVGVLYTI